MEASSDIVREWEIEYDMAMATFVRQLSFLLFIIFPVQSWAQSPQQGPDETGSNVGYEAGLNLGNLLPNQIPGLTEITGLGGMRAGFNVGERAFIEGGFATGKGEGAEWTNTYASFRLDMPVETLVGVAFLGFDATYYKGVGRTKKLFGGGHVGGGLMALVGGAVWFRSNMKFTVNPGTSMYIDFGIVFRFPGDGK